MKFHWLVWLTFPAKNYFFKFIKFSLTETDCFFCFLPECKFGGLKRKTPPLDIPSFWCAHAVSVIASSLILDLENSLFANNPVSHIPESIKVMAISPAQSFLRSWFPMETGLQLCWRLPSEYSINYRTRVLLRKCWFFGGKDFPKWPWVTPAPIHRRVSVFFFPVTGQQLPNELCLFHWVHCSR